MVSLSRRVLLGSALAAGAFAGRPTFAEAVADDMLPPKSPAGIATTALTTRLRAAGHTPIRDNPVAYVEYCRSLGAGGIQHLISKDLPAVRKRLDELEMYYEGQVRLPARRDADLSDFEASVRDSAYLGATVARAVSRPPEGGTGRRYESFRSLAEFRAWQAEADAIVERCLPIAEKYKVAIALENHKDRTVEEHVGFLKRFDSEWLGSLIDPGNNMSFMEDPTHTVTALAPWVKATSLKDMGVAPYEDGFLLAEVRFGTGMTDQKALFAIMQKANPKLLPTTELITRNPLKVPVLTRSYLASFEPAKKARVAPWLDMIKAKATVLETMDGLTPAQQLELEENNNRQVFEWARLHLV